MKKLVMMLPVLLVAAKVSGMSVKERMALFNGGGAAAPAATRAPVVVRGSLVGRWTGASNSSAQEEQDRLRRQREEELRLLRSLKDILNRLNRAPGFQAEDDDSDEDVSSAGSAEGSIAESVVIKPPKTESDEWAQMAVAFDLMEKVAVIGEVVGILSNNELFGFGCAAPALALYEAVQRLGQYTWANKGNGVQLDSLKAVRDGLQGIINTVYEKDSERAVLDSTDGKPSMVDSLRVYVESLI